jgi:hypothetical protein
LTINARSMGCCISCDGPKGGCTAAHGTYTIRVPAWQGHDCPVQAVCMHLRSFSQGFQRTKLPRLGLCLRTFSSAQLDTWHCGAGYSHGEAQGATLHSICRNRVVHYISLKGDSPHKSTLAHQSGPIQRGTLGFYKQARVRSVRWAGLGWAEPGQHECGSKFDYMMPELGVSRIS